VYFRKSTISLLAFVFALAGCVGARAAIPARQKGPWYMEQGRYQEGIADFGRQLDADPQNWQAAYWMGRYHLALNQPDAAIPLLEKAVRLAPRDAEAGYWLGVGYWAQGLLEQERIQYQKVLALDPGHLGANLYLGHNYLDRGELEQAVAQYDRVLQEKPTQPDALFHRAAVQARLGRRNEAKHGWKRFLALYPDGAMALAAADHLNSWGDFDFRGTRVGRVRVAIGRIAFDHLNEVAPESRPSLGLIAERLRDASDFKLHVVVYMEGQPETAKLRSMAVRQAILTQAPGIDPDRLPLSWFGVAEQVEAGGRTWSLAESVHFVTQFQ